MPLESVNCFCFLLWRVPNFTIHARCPFAFIFRHAFHCQHLGTVRVGQQTLQSFHSVPSAFLSCLHDTRLQPTHVPVGSLEVDIVPAFRFAGNCTSRFRFCHLLCFLSRFLKLSRDVRPRGSLLAFAWDDIVLLRLNPYPPHYREAFAFSPLLYPLPHRGHLAVPLPRGMASGLPRSVCIPVRVRSHLFAGGATSASDETTAPVPDHSPVGSSVSAPFACQL
jgi:hypothetical protein